jgi:hypothetical protein
MSGTPRFIPAPQTRPNKALFPKKDRLVTRSGQFTESVAIFVLGTLTDSTGFPRPQLDVYSAINGLNLRTIPGDRWSNPAVVGAGFGLLAVAQRGATFDTVMVTDQYAGADPSVFSNPAAYAAVNWRTLPVVAQKQLTYHVEGMVITNGGLVVITGNPTNSQLAVDIIDLGIGQLTGTIVPKSTEAANGQDITGITCGRPCEINTVQWGAPITQIGCGLWDGANGYVAVIDLATRQLCNLGALPTGYIACSVQCNNDIISVYAKQGSTTAYDRSANYRIFRYHKLPEHFVLLPTEDGLISTDATQVSQSLVRVDSLVTAQTGGLRALRSDVDAKSTEAANNQSQTSPITSDTRLNLNDNRTTTSTDEPVNGFGGKTILPFVSVPLLPVSIPASENGGTSGTAPNETNSGIIDAASSQNTLVELRARYEPVPSTVDGLLAWDFDQEGRSTDLDDTLAPVRLLHGDLFEWMGTGGFTYGCSGSSYTNQVVPLSMAVDLSGDLGTLRLLPDQRALLIDAATGLFIYRMPKPIGYNVYGGRYAVLAPDNGQLTDGEEGTPVNMPDTGSITKTACTTAMLNIFKTKDGVDYTTGYVSAPDKVAYQNNLDYFFPWSHFEPRPHVIGNTVTYRFRPRQWSINSDSGGQLTEWGGSDNSNGGLPVTLLDPSNVVADCAMHAGTGSKLGYMLGKGTFLVKRNPKAGPPAGQPDLEMRSFGAFFVPDIIKFQYTKAQTLALNIAERNIEIAALQAKLNALQSIPAGNQPSNIAAAVTALNNQILSLQTQNKNDQEFIDGGDPSLASITYDYAQSTYDYRFVLDRGKTALDFDANTGALVDAIYPGTGSTHVNPTPPGPGAAFNATSVESGKDGVYVQTGDLSWFIVRVTAIEMADGSSLGPQNSVQDLFETNGLGTPVFSYTYVDPPFGLFPGQTLGYNKYLQRAGVDEGGFDEASFGSSEYIAEIFVNGVPINEIALQISSQDQISAAPADLQPVLLSAYQDGLIPVLQGYGFVGAFTMREPLKTIEVRMQLMTHGRRWYRFYNYMLDLAGEPDQINGTIQDGPDPGFFTCDNTEGPYACHFVDLASENQEGLANQPNFDIPIWEASGVWSFGADPYAAKGILMGRFLNATFNFVLNDFAASYGPHIT